MFFVVVVVVFFWGGGGGGGRQSTQGDPAVMWMGFKKEKEKSTDLCVIKWSCHAVCL